MKLKVISSLKNGTITPEDRMRIADFVRQCFCAGLPCVSITVEAYKKTRSSKQNKYYWGVVIDCVRNLFESYGQTYDDEEVHDILMREVGKYGRAAVMPNNNIHIIRKSSTSLNVQEFEVYLEKVRAWAAENGCDIPLPNCAAIVNK